MTFIPTGYLSLADCVHRVAQRRHPDAAAELSAGRAAHKAIEPLLVKIARIRELKRAAEASASISPIGARHMEYQQTLRAMHVPQLAPEQRELREHVRMAEVQYTSICKHAEVFLRQSFGDARLPTFCLRLCDGELEAIPAPRWWTTAGANAFTSGHWEVNSGTDYSRIVGFVLVREAELEALLLPQDGTAPAEDVISAQASCATADAAHPTTIGPPSFRRIPYSQDGLAAFFVARERGWDKNARCPTGAEDLIAAQAYFEGNIPHYEFLKIRRNNTSKRWRKTGPRGPRK